MGNVIMNTIKLTPEEARSIVWEDHDDWEMVQKDITGKNRWSIDYSGIFKNLPTNKYYMFEWSTGATEQQDEQAYEYDKEVEVVEVVEKEVMVKKWVKA